VSVRATWRYKQGTPVARIGPCNPVPRSPLHPLSHRQQMGESIILGPGMARPRPRAARDGLMYGGGGAGNRGSSHRTRGDTVREADITCTLELALHAASRYVRT
jgi:hypothetical protein